jgi:hypothetical protein
VCGWPHYAYFWDNLVRRSRLELVQTTMYYMYYMCYITVLFYMRSMCSDREKLAKFLWNGELFSKRSAHAKAAQVCTKSFLLIAGFNLRLLYII